MTGGRNQNIMEVGSNSEVVEAIREMTNAIGANCRGSNIESVDDRILRIQGEFRKSKPYIFRGSSDPMIAEEWVRQIKRSLMNMRIPEDLQVLIACTYLEGQAYHWWESVLCIPNVVIAKWDEFEKNFLEKYFPSTQRRQKAREFANLRQMLMSVGDYQDKFEELMRFAPDLVSDDCAKARRFEDGLRLQIRGKVMMLKLDRYIDVVERALMAEQIYQESKAIWKASYENRVGRSNKHKRPNSHQDPHNSRPAKRPKRSYQCGQEGHISINCRSRSY